MGSNNALLLNDQVYDHILIINIFDSVPFGCELILEVFNGDV